MTVIRYQDHRSTGTSPPIEVKPALLDGDRVICVQSVEDELGFAWARVWIASDE